MSACSNRWFFEGNSCLYPILYAIDPWPGAQLFARHTVSRSKPTLCKGEQRHRVSDTKASHAPDYCDWFAKLELQTPIEPNMAYFEAREAAGKESDQRLFSGTLFPNSILGDLVCPVSDCCTLTEFVRSSFNKPKYLQIRPAALAQCS